MSRSPACITDDAELIQIVAAAIKRKLTLISDSWAEIAARAAVEVLVREGPLRPEQPDQDHIPYRSKHGQNGAANP